MRGGGLDADADANATDMCVLSVDATDEARAWSADRCKRGWDDLGRSAQEPLPDTYGPASGQPLSFDMLGAGRDEPLVSVLCTK